MARAWDNLGSLMLLQIPKKTSCFSVAEWKCVEASASRRREGTWGCCRAGGRQEFLGGSCL